MRVLLVSREFAPFYGGGIGTYASEAAAVLACAGHEVHILTGPHDHVLSRGPALRPGVVFHTADLESGDAALDAYPTFPMRYSMAVLEAVRRLCIARPFDYIEFPDYHAEGYFTIRAKRTLGEFASSVLAVRLHSTSWICREADRDPRLTPGLAHIEHMERSALAEADLVVAPGQRSLDRIAAPHPGHPPWPGRRTAIIRPPIDPERLARELGGGAPSAAHTDEPDVLFFGKLQHLKGPHDLVEAALLLLARGRGVRFRFIGGDSPTGPLGAPMLAHLLGRIPPGLRSRFIFEPARPRDRLGGAIRAATVVCLPSRWECYPMVCLEALAVGAPVVAADAGGLGEIIRHGESGLLTPPGDPGALADALDRVLGDPVLRERLGRAGPARARELCSPERAVREIAAAVKEFRAGAPGAQNQTAGPRGEAGALEPRSESPLPAHPRTPAATPDLSAPPHRASPAPHSSPRVSILIPYYNLGRYLPETLASVRAQTFTDYEVIIVDDGSTDPHSVALLDRLPPGVRVVRKPNGGLSSTRNAGLAAARARWVLPLDADDLIEPTLLERLMAAAARDPGLSYISPLVAYFTDDPARPTGGWVPLGPDRDLLVAQNIGGAASGSLLDREAALEVGGYDPWLTSYEDWEFWCKLAAAGKRGTVVPAFLLRYRVRADSMFRTVALERHAALHAYILERHPGLPLDPSRAMRLLASLSTPSDAAAAARALIDENLRYRVVDRMNAALKRTGLQTPLKAAAITVLRAGRRARGTIQREAGEGTS